MELFCTAKSAVEVGDTIECTAFILRDRKLEPGTKLEQRRDGDEGPMVIASWELVELTTKSLILKKGDGSMDSIQSADGFYVEALIEEKPIEVPTMSVLVFSGKNWKLASAKKWVPMDLAVDGCPSVGEMSIGGKEYVILKLAEGFAARLKTAS
jgi:hypothetical protein